MKKPRAVRRRIASRLALSIVLAAIVFYFSLKGPIPASIAYVSLAALTIFSVLPIFEKESEPETPLPTDNIKVMFIRRGVVAVGIQVLVATLTLAPNAHGVVTFDPKFYNETVQITAHQNGHWMPIASFKLDFDGNGLHRLNIDEIEE